MNIHPYAGPMTRVFFYTNGSITKYELHRGDDDQYSVGPFCRVCFSHGRDGLKLYTPRAGRVEDAHTLVNTIQSLWDGGPTFTQLYTEPCYLPRHA